MQPVTCNSSSNSSLWLLLLVPLLPIILNFLVNGHGDKYTAFPVGLDPNIQLFRYSYVGHVFDFQFWNSDICFF